MTKKIIIIIVSIFYHHFSQGQTKYYFTIENDNGIVSIDSLIKNDISSSDPNKIYFSQISKRRLRKQAITHQEVVLKIFRRSLIDKNLYSSYRKISASIKDTLVELKDVYEKLFLNTNNIQTFIDRCLGNTQDKNRITMYFNGQLIWTLYINETGNSFWTLDDLKHWNELIQSGFFKRSKSRILEYFFGGQMYDCILLDYWAKNTGKVNN
jgi:hypothetical protein